MAQHTPEPLKQYTTFFLLTQSSQKRRGADGADLVAQVVSVRPFSSQSRQHVPEQWREAQRLTEWFVEFGLNAELVRAFDGAFLGEECEHSRFSGRIDAPEYLA